jgi:sterol desaturase/sphingolipid hydroxylase (fatty acid hydroxylase superfamily)
MLWGSLLATAVAFTLALVTGTLAEYVVHRLMHTEKVLGRKHAEHHRDGWGQGWAGEFLDYFVGSLILILPVSISVWLLLDCPWPAGGWAAGGTLYAALAAYSHQLQHEKPELVFWLPRPVHYLHHKHHMWHHNFGILVDWWDRAFGTYQAAEWMYGRPRVEYSLRAFLDIKWY